MVLTIGAARGHMPPLALGCTAAEARAALPLADRLARAGVPILVCRFDPAPGEAAADLHAFRALADRGYAIELQIVVHEVADFAAELHRAAAAVRDAGLAPAMVAVSPASDLKSTTPGQPWPPSPPLDALARAARTAFAGIRLAGGMFSYFTELNRRRPPVALLDAVTFSTSPLVHAADDRSVMESLQAIPAVAASARAIAGDRPFVVGPSAIGLRDNPYGAAPLPSPTARRLAMSGEDPRQRGQFNAAWTLGYVAGFAAEGAARIAVSAPVGAFGILDPDSERPVFGVVQGLAALRGAVLRPLDRPDAPLVNAPLADAALADAALAGLVAEAADRRELWLANLGAEPREVVVPAPFGDAGGAPLLLGPYAVLRRVA